MSKRPLHPKKATPRTRPAKTPPAAVARPAVAHRDGAVRCPWPGSDPLYVAYHDQEWGVPERDSRALYEKLILDGFQAGLSWITILRKREAFRRAFDAFQPHRIVRYDAHKIDVLMADAGIVRNRAKIEATIAGARAWLEIEAKTGFAHYIWSFVDGQPVHNHYRTMREIPAATDLSRTIAKDLRARGFNFCGPTVVYAFMQACGLVNDHLVDCYRHASCGAIVRS
jgi:DNA-3-methyladenine glycosylase I